METDLYLDNDGYPTDLALVLIEQANPFEKNPHNLMAFIKSLWQYSDWGWSEKKKKDFFGKKVISYSISTGGWSGNESLISALKNNKNFFWTLYWKKSKVGGHYKFAIPKKVITKESIEKQIPDSKNPKVRMSCGLCGEEMSHNVPRLGEAGGFIHRETRKFECNTPKAMDPIDPIDPIDSKTLKFRVWDHLIKTWSYFDIRNAFGHIPADIPDNQIQQFTGFLDKNGKEVYEGDILEFFGLRGVVTYFACENGCYFAFLCENDNSTRYPLYKRSVYKKVGNIYDDQAPTTNNKPNS
jgi:hypothetical protein